MPLLAVITEYVLYRLHGWVALAIVFLLPALEASAFVGFVFPGEIAVIIGGVLAYQGKVPLWGAIAAAVLGAAIGDSVGYLVGRRFGRSILRGTLGRLPVIRHHLDKHLARAEEYVRRRGPQAVLIGRFTAALRVLVPGLAGMAELPYGTFALYNVAGAIVWGTGFVLLGFFGGAAWRRVAGYASKSGLVLLVSIILALILTRVLRSVRDRGETLTSRLARTRPLAWVRRRFPAQSAWLARRIDPFSPMGFILSFTVVGGLIAAWIFGGVLQDVLAREEVVRRDPGILRWTIAHRTAWLNQGFEAATWLGSNAVLIPASAVVAATVGVARRIWSPLMQLALAIIASNLAYRLVKTLVSRPRPPASFHLVHVSGYAFPSGHATSAVAVWGTIALVLVTGRSARAKAALWTVASLLALAVGASRVYLGVHWFTDVLGGLALGTVILACVATLALVAGGRRTRPGRGSVIRLRDDAKQIPKSA